MRYQNTALLDEIVRLLEIPPEYYERARARGRDLGEWFLRPDSTIRHYSPDIYPQGSFRYGTVIRPLHASEEYDLDLACQLLESKTNTTQSRIKGLVGTEVDSYAKARGIEEPPDEKRRCWRLNYQDSVKFHMDILPCVPDDEVFKAHLIRIGVPKELAVEAIGITDMDEANYDTVTADWPRSNPRGFAGWFEGRMKSVAEGRIQELVQAKAYAAIEDVPSYEWKTPLQRSIQLLKRHRDVMFHDDAELKPISMIITTLAAHAYNGESDLAVALSGIVDRMLGFVNDRYPRVPNPVNPGEDGEDFADRWKDDPRLETNFRAWHRQVQADLRHLNESTDPHSLREVAARSLDVKLGKNMPVPTGAGTIPAVAAAVPVVHVASPPKPWQDHA